MILVDVGVWLAAVWGAHAQHPLARGWFERESSDLAFCRVTQMSLLRLLGNPAIMRGDAMTRSAAWDVYDTLLGDARIVFVDEPSGTETVWRSYSRRDDRSHKLWTDDYLAAFAQASGCRVATLDRAFAQRLGPALVAAVE